ncbi:MAG: hypothetical protein K0R02_380, partial [Rickettsiaceae bacterium]|nr:hypothetical protein [Rickettsiaceae bacterium]
MPDKTTLNITSKDSFAQRLIQAIEEHDLDHIKKLVENDQEVMERHFEIYFVKGEYSASYTILHLLSLANYTQA